MRLIDADEAIANIQKTIIGASDFARDIRDAACNAVGQCKSIDAVPVVHGRWEMDRSWNREIFYRCSSCGNPDDNKCAYCSHCGAKMDGKDGDRE